MNVLNSVIKQTTWQILGKIITSLSTIIILGVITRKFHEAGTGIFTLSLTYLGIFSLLADFGLNAHVLRQSNFEWNKLFGTRIIWSLFLIVLSILILPFLPFTSEEIYKSILFGSLGILGSSIFITCNLIFQAKLRYDLSVFSSSIGIIIGFLFYLWFADNNYPIFFLLIAQSISWILIAVFSLIFVRKFLPTLLPKFDFKYIKTLFGDTWMIAATLALNVIYFRVDSFLLAFFKGISDVGIYNVAFQVFQSALVLPTFVMNAYYPLMLKSLSKVRYVGTGLFILSLIATIFTWIFAPFAIGILTGGSFGGSILSLQILSLGFPAFFVSALLMWYLVTKGMYKQMLGIYLFGLLVNLILNFIFIPKYSYIASSWITVLSEYLILTLQAVVLSRK